MSTTQAPPPSTPPPQRTAAPPGATQRRPPSAPPRPGATTSPPARPVNPAKQFAVSKGRVLACERIGIYGEGGVGKTSLAKNLAFVGINPLFLDLEDGSNEMDISRINGITSWEELRDVLQDVDLRKDFQAVVIDPMTKIEELAEEYILRTQATSKGGKATSFRQFGWDGPSFIMERFLEFLTMCDVIRRTHHVILISHLTTDKVPNAGGDDYLCFQPRMQKTSNADCRAKFKEWCAHLFFLEFERETEKNKATGGGTRIVRTVQAPHYWAKSRSLKDDVAMNDEDDPSVWHFLFNNDNKE